jgi:hypothetical protein
LAEWSLTLPLLRTGISRGSSSTHPPHPYPATDRGEGAINSALYREIREKPTFRKIRESFTALPSLKNATASGTVKSKYFQESSVSEVQTDRQTVIVDKFNMMSLAIVPNP